MNSIKKTVSEYTEGIVDKQTFIKKMYEYHHAKIFEYTDYLPHTNVKKIEIQDGRVIMTSRDRGIRIMCTPNDLRIAPIETLNFFDYEKNESTMMENLISNGDNFFDIGANIGWYSINIAISRRATQVYCFEPIPQTYKFLLNNLELNSIKNVNANNFGLSNQAGEFVYFYYTGGSVNASAVNVTDRTDVETVQCQVRTLDDYILEVGVSVDFIKCDVEGAELLVFQGGIETIKRDKPIVFSEILRKWSAKFNYNPNEIFEMFYQQGYQAYTVNGDYLSRFFNMTESTAETNFFFLHVEKHTKLIQRFENITNK